MVLHILILSLLSGSNPVFATDVDPAIFAVNSANAQHYNVSIKIAKASPLCGRAEDVYVSFPSVFKELKFKYINVSVESGDSLLLSFSPVLIENNDQHDEAEHLHRSTMCVDSSLLSHVSISLGYGKSELVRTILKISGLEEFDSSDTAEPI